MSQILDTIVAAKKIEVQSLREKFSIADFEKTNYYYRTPVSLGKKLQQAGSTGIIAEFKRKSPSKGSFTEAHTDVEPVVKAYEQHGATGISVLTDRQFFGGSMIDLYFARQAVAIPILLKDFIIDPLQIYQAKAGGADVILLIAAILSPAQVKEFAGIAKSIGLETLLEIHKEAELAHICHEVDIIGVNNRNLQTFEVDVETSRQLIKKLPGNKPAISESGISNVETIVALRQAGFCGFLIGEQFMKQPEPAIAFARFTDALKKAH